MKLNPEVFYPPPKVTSAVVHIEALKSPKFEANLTSLEKVVAMAFNQRRKMLRSSLKKLSPNIEKILTDLNIDPAARAENLSIEEYCLGERAVFSIGSEGLWLRQGNNLEQSVIRANRANFDGSILYDVTIISFAQNGSATRRLEAKKAIIRDKNWHLSNVKQWPLGKGLSSEKSAQTSEKLIIPSNLTKEEIRERVSDPSSVSIWDLKTFPTLSCFS